MIISRSEAMCVTRGTINFKLFFVTDGKWAFYNFYTHPVHSLYGPQMCYLPAIQLQM